MKPRQYIGKGRVFHSAFLDFINTGRSILQQVQVPGICPREGQIRNEVRNSRYARLFTSKKGLKGSGADC